MAAKKKKPEEKSETPTDNTRSMRDAAEKKRAGSPGIFSDLAGQTAEELIHELQVHQTELEKQAEELRRTSLTLEESRDKYRDQYLDLYEFAPISYLTLTDKAQVTGANLTVATLLGVDRNALINHGFRKFIAPGDLDLWDRYFVSARRHGEKQTCTLTLRRGDGSVFPARLESIRLTGSSDGTTTIRVAISDITEICRAEEEIKFKNVILSTQQETSPDGILAIDENGKILSFNRHFIELWGIPDNVIASRSDERALQPVLNKLADPDAFVARVTYLYDHKDEKSREEILLKDGRVLDRYSAPMVGQDQKYYGRVWYFRDITERKRAEEALRESEARLSLAMEVGNAGVWEWNLESDEVHFDARFHAILGYTPGELPTTLKEWMPYHNQEDVPVWRGKAEAYLRGDSPVYESEHRIRNKEGNWEWVFTRGRLMTRTITGSPKLFIGFAMNVTERKQAEEALRESEAQLRTLIHTIPDLVWLKDPEGVYLSCNRRFERFFGAAEKDIVGKTDYDFMDRDRGDFFRHHDKAAIAAGGPTTNEEEITFAEDGHREILETIKTPIHASDGRLIGVLGIGRNITERKRAADMLALTSRKLALMNDMTYQFIQNKVTGLRGYAELSKDAKTEAERLSFIKKEEHILADIQHLIKNTQDYQEIGLLQPRWIPVEQSIRIAVSLVSPKQDISIETALHGLELYFDPLIEKIFANLIDNTVKHGKTTTYIRFFCEETPDGLILICEDDGVGISPDVKASLFDRSVGKNIHFGLFFVLECLVLSGITIAETGTQGKGARFEIIVPKGMYRLREGI